jgi:hypothetical protein
VTDATAIQARWTLTSDRLAMPHMPATGVSGLDLYALENGRWHWLGVGRPDKTTNTATLATGLPAGKRTFLLYLPLYNGVASVEIGVAKGATLAKAELRPKGHDTPILFYGTSITQSGAGDPVRGTRSGRLRPRLPAEHECGGGDGAHGAIRDDFAESASEDADCAR